jgi:starvation-inducible DNA-binding protein
MNAYSNYFKTIAVAVGICISFLSTAQTRPDYYRNEKADERIALEKENRVAVALELQAMTVELIELHGQAKQCHWNMKGPLYISLHELLDEYDETFLDYADRVAERLLHIGAQVDGRSQTVAKTANIETIPAGAITDKLVLDLMSEHIYLVAVRTRQRITKLSKLDEVSSNLLQDLSYKLDKQVWQLRAHQQ